MSTQSRGWVAVGVPESSLVQIVNATNGVVGTTLYDPSEPSYARSVAFSPDGALL